RTVSEYYTPRTEFDEKFDRVLNELQRDREEQARKWDEQNRKWDEQNRKWEENTQRLDRIEAQNSATLEEIQKANRRYESAIGG
ncbi:hypothetical protein FHK94_16205, partial [Cylindrospermopsis raciborskii CS-506_D]|nr:hypothetical protein [Cylindrospermopsis raciborskii CS-506_D]